MDKWVVLVISQNVWIKSGLTNNALAKHGLSGNFHPNPNYPQFPMHEFPTSKTKPTSSSLGIGIYSDY